MKIPQDMQVEFNKEIELLKKFQTEIKLEMKNWGCLTKATQAGLPNMLQGMEERFSGCEEKKEEMDSSVKENGNSKTSQAQSILKIGTTMKKSNVRI